MEGTLLQLTRPVTGLYQGWVCLGKTTYLFKSAATVAATTATAAEEISLSATFDYNL